MSHVQCPKCQSNNHTQGYGFAAGPMGSYTICDDCNYVIELSVDIQGLTAEESADMVKRYNRPKITTSGEGGTK